MTKDIDLDALQALAEKATPGPWDYDTNDTPYRIAGGEVVGGDSTGIGEVYTAYDCPGPDDMPEPKVIARDVELENGRFIRAANPQTILSPIARIRELEGDTGKSAEADKSGRTLAQSDIEYPRDVFSDLISRNSPYAFYLFQWVPYQTEAKCWRLKMCHDVRTFDGREAHGIWPNGDHCGPFRDDEVEFIRISRSQHGEEWKDPRPTAGQDAAISAGRAAPEGGKP